MTAFITTSMRLNVTHCHGAPSWCRSLDTS